VTLVNFTSVTVKGALNFGRARALWKDGMLRIFGVDGLLVETNSERPTRRPGHLLTWDAKTARGDITLRTKCITCGGRRWWRIVAMSPEELWSS
jgi:hypothetical protein